MSIFADDRIIFTLTNSTDFGFQNISMNFKSGGYKSGSALPSVLGNFGLSATAYMGDNFGLAGVTGYVSFTLNGTLLYLYLSSPYVGQNKIGFGLSQAAANTQAGQNSSNYNYNQFTQTIVVNNTSYSLTMGATSGDSIMIASFNGPID